MSNTPSDLKKFFIFVLLCLSGGIVFLCSIQRLIPYSGDRNSPFRWVIVGIILTVVTVPSSYWIFTRRKRDATSYTLAKVGFASHLLGYTIIHAMLITYNLVVTPQKLWVHSPLIIWGVILVAHGLLSWRMKEPPEELFP